MCVMSRKKIHSANTCHQDNDFHVQSLGPFLLWFSYLQCCEGGCEGMLIPVGLVCSRVCAVGLRAGYEIL